MMASPYVFPGLTTRPKVRLFANPDSILNAVIAETGIDKPSILSKHRRASFVKARHLFYYLCSLHCSISLAELGRLCDTHHSSVIHARDNMRQMIEMDQSDYRILAYRIARRYGQELAFPKTKITR